MEQHECPKCKQSFFTAIIHAGATIRCPYCSFEIIAAGREKRSGVRARVDKNCILSAGNESITVKVIDICERGIGILAERGIPPAMEANTFRVVVEDFEIDAKAMVAWKAGFDGGSTRAGLRFV